jgi:hypothetical protein
MKLKDVEALLFRFNRSVFTENEAVLEASYRIVLRIEWKKVSYSWRGFRHTVSAVRQSDLLLVSNVRKKENQIPVSNCAMEGSIL